VATFPNPPSHVNKESITRDVEKLGPWITGFTACDTNFGGQYFAEYDTRIQQFLRYAGAKRLEFKNILECGSFEGGHTSALALALPKAQITGAEIRKENIAKAKLLMEVRDLKNVIFLEDDLEEKALSFDSSYDAVVCIGLLYHLRDPLKFLRRAAKSSPMLWLWTQYCAEPDANFIEGNYRGKIYTDSVTHPLSGVKSESFFPSLGSLNEMILEAGYNRIEIFSREVTEHGDAPAILLGAKKI
jgi:Methyltransferase domain